MNTHTLSQGISSGTVTVLPLGGSGEFGINMMVYQYNEDIIVVDSGVMFPDGYAFGVELFVPDISYLINRKQNVRAIILSHGHEDHIGGLAYVLQALGNVPVLGSPLTLALAAERLKEAKLNADLRQVGPDDTIELGCFSISFAQISHSIPDALSIFLRTPIGVIVHTSEFKWDSSSVYNTPTEAHKFSALGEEGQVLLLVSDSTNASRPGNTRAEHTLDEILEGICRDECERVFISTFSSHLFRIQHVMDIAARTGRAVALAGRSLIRNVELAQQLGLITIPPGLLVPIKDLRKPRIQLLPGETRSVTTAGDADQRRVVIICTGSQAETHAALTLIASGQHKVISIGDGDLVVLSARRIPGRERQIGYMVDQILRHGARVHEDSAAPVHVSGHGAADDLKRMMQILRPRAFMPIHGEYRMLVEHGRLAEEVGIPHDSVILACDGDAVALTEDAWGFTDSVPTGRVGLAGRGLREIPASIIADRHRLAHAGVISVVVAVSEATGLPASAPALVLNGVMDGDSVESLDGATAAVLNAIERLTIAEIDGYRTGIRKAVDKYFEKRTGFRPLVIPVIVKVP